MTSCSAGRSTSLIWVPSIVLMLLAASGVFSEIGASGCLAETVREQIIELVSRSITVENDSVSVLVDLPSFGLSTNDVIDIDVGLMSSKPVSGTVPVRVTFLMRDGESASYAVAARVGIYDRVLVSTRRLNRHDVITEDCVRLERREITNITDGYFKVSGRVEGKRVRRVIAAGTLIKTSDVEAIPLVPRGSDVTLSFVMGAVIVTSRARALEDGEMDELIKVQDLTTGKRLIGMVRGKRLVIMDESML